MSERVELMLSNVRGPAVLDVGCVGGQRPGAVDDWLHVRLRKQFEEVWGLDASEEGLQELRKMGWDNLEQGDAQEFDLGRRFDSIVAGELIEHLENPGRFLTRARNHLHQGGRVILSTPYAFGAHHWLYSMIRFPKTCSNPEHVAWFCPRTLLALAERSGFIVRSWDLVSGYDGDPGKSLVRAFYGVMRALRPILPKRLRATTMVFILEVPGEVDASPRDDVL